jgi:hypothetical protein
MNLIDKKTANPIVEEKESGKSPIALTKAQSQVVLGSEMGGF